MVVVRQGARQSSYSASADIYCAYLRKIPAPCAASPARPELQKRFFDVVHPHRKEPETQTGLPCLLLYIADCTTYRIDEK